MRINIKTVGMKALCVLSAAALLCGCGDNALSRLDNTSSEDASSAPAITTTTTAKPADSSAAESKTFKTIGKTKKTDEIQMIPDGAYDITPIIKAHKSGDTSALNPNQEAILEAALEFINDCTSEEMSPVEKELAVHDKLILETEYDSEQLNPLGEYDKYSETPYGALINKTAICSGFALTFNLLMKLMGIECITVEGSRSDGKAHMWNQVKLGKDWYCVDTTWDGNHYDDGDLVLKHKYFNSTTEFFLNNNHVFEEKDYPAAAGTKYSYMNTLMTKQAVYAFGIEDFEQLFRTAVENKTGEIVFIPDYSFMNLYSADLSSEDVIKEIKDLFIENDCWYLETLTEETEIGLTAMVVFRTIKEEERPKEDSSEDESSDSESSESEKDTENKKDPESESESESESETENAPAEAPVTDDNAPAPETEEKQAS